MAGETQAEFDFMALDKRGRRGRGALSRALSKVKGYKPSPGAMGLAGLVAFLGLEAAPGIVRGVSGAQDEARTLRGLMDNPDLLRSKINEMLGEGEMDAFIEARDRERLARLGIQDPSVLDTVRALASGSATPRLADGETRIGGANDNEMVDRLLSRSDLFGGL